MDTDTPFFETNTTGGFLRVSGYTTGQFSGRESAFGRFIYYYNFRNPGSAFSDRMILGFSLEAGRAFDNGLVLDSGNLKYSSAVLVGINTVIGPAYLAHGFNFEGGGVSYFYLGNPF